MTNVLHDFNKQMQHLTALKVEGSLGNLVFYVSRSDQVKIIYNGKHTPYKDFMTLFPNLNELCRG